MEGHDVRRVLEEPGDVPDHVPGVAVLPPLPVHPQLEPQVVGIGDLVGDTESLHDALTAWASLIQDVANEYRGVVDGVTPISALQEPTPRPLSVAS